MAELKKIDSMYSRNKDGFPSIEKAQELWFLHTKKQSRTVSLLEKKEEINN